MSDTTTARLPPWLGDLVRLAILVALAAILTAALVFQFAGGELPCPLCLLQRVAMLGTTFVILEQFREGFSPRRTGFAMVWSLFLLVVSTRQVLMVIVPRAGHDYPGSAVLGLHMPVWSVVIALVLLAALAVELMLAPGARPDPPQAVRPSRLARWLGLYVLVLAAINLVAALLQCGGGACHTTGYALLGG